MDKNSSYYDPTTINNQGGINMNVGGINGGETCFTLFTPEAVGNTHGIILVSSYSLVIAMVLATNIALIVGLYKTNSALTLAQRLFVLMSSMDLVIGIIFLPLNIYTIKTSHAQHCGIIMIQAFVSMFFPFMSGLVLLLVVAHRFLLVVNTPLTRKLAERRHIRFSLMVSVLFSASMSIWYVFQKKTKSVTSHGTFYLVAGVIVSGYIFIITSINLKLLHFLKKAKKSKFTFGSLSIPLFFIYTSFLCFKKRTSEDLNSSSVLSTHTDLDYHSLN